MAGTAELLILINSIHGERLLLNNVTMEKQKIQSLS